AAIARQLGRPVKWIEERRESLAAASQARAQRMDVEVAVGRDGVLLGLRARAVSDGGAYHIYPLTGALEPLGSLGILPGPYRTSVYEYEAVTVATHKPPLGAYRGAGLTMGASSASASPATRSTRAWAPRSSAGEGCRTCRASKPPR